ncbi:chaperone modulator CbpM [uncultured Pluralibacter sp.]|uniref:chaperone modulator CbpM n=1 Tax=uncultured Pluralibacter sp. TaxID=1490864 RepID=UPI0026189750|nr:chaperone modulator CbpM [uncultured Pluralibacter sp.]
MANITITVTEFCLYTGVSEEELDEIVGLGMIEPCDTRNPPWHFDDSAVALVQEAMRLRRELALDWPGTAVTLTLLEENRRLQRENHQLIQRLTRFTSH